MSPIASKDKGIIKRFDHNGDTLILNEVFTSEFFGRLYLPYCFKKMYEDEDVEFTAKSYPYKYLPLNRNYVPVGLVGVGYVNHEDYPHHIIRSKIPFFKIKNVFDNDEPITKDLFMFYMYTNSSQALSNYLSRLNHLMTYIDDCESNYAKT